MAWCCAELHQAKYKKKDALVLYYGEKLAPGEKLFGEILFYEIDKKLQKQKLVVVDVNKWDDIKNLIANPCKGIIDRTSTEAKDGQGGKLVKLGELEELKNCCNAVLDKTPGSKWVDEVIKKFNEKGWLQNMCLNDGIHVG
ncbi:hypothetical protein MY11210_004288 [Beauveria gryllotalpidicola]